MNVRNRVDYDKIAPTYDRRFEGNGMPGVAASLLELARQLGAERVLEVGCGTGRWLADLHEITAHLHGLDLSAGMLSKAQDRSKLLRLVRGRADRLSFPASSFDLVYCVNAIHHFDQQREFVFEARRLLRSGGALAVIGMDPHDRREGYYLYRFFHGAYETDLVRFPSWGTVLDWMALAGFEQVTWRVAERIYDQKVGRSVLEDPFLDQSATSQLTLLSDEAYAEGIARIRAAVEAAEAVGEQEIFPVDILIGMVVGWVG
jgi:ubiquinone/menaquinone biosynthesis C-methylase UbiE